MSIQADNWSNNKSIRLKNCTILYSVTCMLLPPSCLSIVACMQALTTIAVTQYHRNNIDSNPRVRYETNCNPSNLRFKCQITKLNYFHDCNLSLCVEHKTAFFTRTLIALIAAKLSISHMQPARTSDVLLLMPYLTNETLWKYNLPPQLEWFIPGNMANKTIFS